MHNGNGRGNGKRWLLIGLAILIGFWLVNDAYDDGYRDALVQTGEAPAVMRRYHGGPDFPWGLVILGGIGYIAWRKGAFDRFGGPGGPWGGGGRYVGGYGDGPQGGYPPAPTGGPAPGQGFGPGFRGPRSFFDEWHRQAHDAMAHRAAPPAPPAPPAGPAPAQAGNGSTPEAEPAPPPPPPAPDYWAAMARAAGTEYAGAPGTSAPATAPEARADGTTSTPYGATGPAPERW